MADTTTVLNSGSGGDKMDESLVTQVGDGVTQAKRPRTVHGGDAGSTTDVYGNKTSDLVQPVNTNPGANPVSAPALGVAVVDDTPQVYAPQELRPLSMTPEGRLRVSSVAPDAPASFSHLVSWETSGCGWSTGGAGFGESATCWP